MNIDLGHLPQRPWRRYKLDEQVASELFLLYPREYDEMAHVEAESGLPSLNCFSI